MVFSELMTGIENLSASRKSCLTAGHLTVEHLASSMDYLVSRIEYLKKLVWRGP